MTQNEGINIGQHKIQHQHNHHKEHRIQQYFPQLRGSKNYAEIFHAHEFHIRAHHIPGKEAQIGILQQRPIIKYEKKQTCGQ